MSVYRIGETRGDKGLDILLLFLLRTECPDNPLTLLCYTLFPVRVADRKPFRKRGRGRDEGTFLEGGSTAGSPY